MRPSNCPKFDKCNAPICPLDANHLQSCHIEGERICLYLRESVKPAAQAILEATLPGGMLAIIHEAAPGIVSRWGSIRRGLEHASLTGSTIARQPPMRGAHGTD
jgi:hypothetical protein